MLPSSLLFILFLELILLKRCGVCCEGWDCFWRQVALIKARLVRFLRRDKDMLAHQIDVLRVGKSNHRVLSGIKRVFPYFRRQVKLS